MKTFNKSLFIAALLLLSVSVFAQRFGVKAGLNIANMAMKAGGEKVEDLKSVMGFHVGATADFAITESLIFQPGLLLSVKGTKMEQDYMGETMTVSTKPMYIEIPLNVMYAMEIGGGELFGAVGPYIGYGIGGNTKVEFDGDSESEKISWGSDEEEDDMKAMDFGVNIGAGFGMSNGLYFMLGYGLGLANSVPGGDGDNSAKNRVFSVSLGYKLGK